MISPAQSTTWLLEVLIAAAFVFVAAEDSLEICVVRAMLRLDDAVVVEGHSIITDCTIIR